MEDDDDDDDDDDQIRPFLFGVRVCVVCGFFSSSKDYISGCYGKGCACLWYDGL